MEKNNKKSIVWVTAACFVDVDIDVVPALARLFNIHWYIWGGMAKGDAKRMHEVAETDSLKIDYITMKNKWYSPFIYFEYRKVLKRIIKKDSLLYVDTGGVYFYQALNSVCDKDKTVLAIHNVKTPKGARLEKIARYNTKYAVKHFKNIQTFSRNQHEYLNSLVSDKNVLEAPLMLKDYGEPTKETTDNTFNFLTFGQIREYKRVDLLIKAAQEMAERTDRKFKVTIAGYCKNWEQQYQSLITKPELFDLHIGFVENEDIPNYFNDADFFVLPYQDLAQSGAITVAFQYNVPVITSDIIQFKEFNDGKTNGLMFKSCDSHALSVEMERALNLSTEAVVDMKKAQASFVENVFSAKAILAKYADYLERL